MKTFTQWADENHVTQVKLMRDFGQQIWDAALEEAAALCDRFAGRAMHPTECAAAIRNMARTAQPTAKSVPLTEEETKQKNNKAVDTGDNFASKYICLICLSAKRGVHTRACRYFGTGA